MHNLPWSSEELIKLHKLYPVLPTKELAGVFNRHELAIKRKAGLLGIRKINPKNKNSNLSVLLGNDLVAFYWMGYLLADGYFSSNSIKLASSVKDSIHLSAFADFITSPVKQYISSSGYNAGRPYLEVRGMDSDVVPRIIEKFSIPNNKTYNPPSFSSYNFTDEQLIAMIIGFIDGDGSINSIRRDSNFRITIHSHISWKENLDFMNTCLHNYFGYTIANSVTIDKRGFAYLSVGKSDLVNSIKLFISDNSLPVMRRKWFRDS